MGRTLARYKGRAVRTSYHGSVLDPATMLRYAQDDVGWRMLEHVRVILNFRWHQTLLTQVS